MTIIALPHGGVTTNGNIRTSGPGQSIAKMKANFQAGSSINMSAAWGLPTVPSTTRPTTGAFWFGVMGGVGVQYDFATSLVSHVMIAADGSVTSIVSSRSYVAADWGQYWGPAIYLQWCGSLDCDRLQVGATLFGLDGLPPSTGVGRMLATVWLPDSEPHGSVPIVFGCSVDSTSPLEWNLECQCLSDAYFAYCSTCQDDYPTWPEPGRVQVTGSFALSEINTGTRGDPNFTQLSSVLANLDSGVLSAIKATDANGVDLILGNCEWFKQWQSVLTQTPGSVIPSGTVTERIFATLFRGATSPGHNLPTQSGFVQLELAHISANPCITLTGGPIDVTKWHLVITYEVKQVVGSYYLNTFFMIYEGVMPQSNAAATFTLVAIGNDTASACASAAGLPFIDASTVPTSLSLEWIVTAPPCVCAGEAAYIAGWVGGIPGGTLIWYPLLNDTTNAYEGFTGSLGSLTDLRCQGGCHVTTFVPPLSSYFGADYLAFVAAHGSPTSFGERLYVTCI